MVVQPRGNTGRGARRILQARSWRSALARLDFQPVRHLHLIVMSTSRLDRGQSDPIAYTCTCPASSIGGTVLLFYRYWSNIPQLPSQEVEKTKDLESLAAWHKDLTEKYNLTGKIRIAIEGYNVTVAGTSPEIDGYIRHCCQHWSFAGLPLDTEKDQQLFFKPSNGCPCVFGPQMTANIRITSEITPMGIEGYAPIDWGNVEALLPEEFHKRCYEEKSLLLDVRNIYESRIGYFIDPHTGEPAVRPPIRRFSQWPQYIEHHLQDVGGEQKQVMTYCTGGIRCEKATRWMQEKIGSQRGQKVCTLQGGIAAYLTWMDEEIKQGRKTPAESLFRGRNYVFDARGSVGLSINTPVEPVSRCHVCAAPSDNLSKCSSKGCHLILVVCPACEKKDPRCCQSCRDMDAEVPLSTRPRPMCMCESEREEELWGGQRVKVPKTQGWRKARRKALVGVEHIDVQIKTID
jgi:predicted sulfurtransferase